MRKKMSLAEKIKSMNKYHKLMFVLVFFYTIISFFRLGNIDSPKTFLNLKKDYNVIFELTDDTIPNEILFFNGHDNVYITTFLCNDNPYEYSNFKYDTSVATDYGDVYTWKRANINIQNERCKYIMISSYWDTTSIGELAFLDENGKKINVKLLEGDGQALIDEQNLLQTKKTYMNSTYFDEVYFPRAAYEIFNHTYIFEYTHPPLGKILMWIGMSLFGISPFSFRMMGNIAGIIMIIVFYIIGKDLFDSEKCGFYSALIMSLDGMHFAQTRIGTVDSFLVLFCLLSFMFFLKYLKEKNDKRKKYIYFALSGISWGCAISVKWTGAYTGLGLGILFFVDYFVNQKVINNKKINYMPLLIGAVCFVIIPIFIYIASYIPIFQNENEVSSYSVEDEYGNKESVTSSPHSIKGFLMYQYAMYQYHSSIGTGKDYVPHPYSSKWYTWPVIYKPMWFYSADFENNMKGTIASMGNPAIWWLGIVTTIFMLVHSIIKKNKSGWIIMIMLLSTWMPYAFIGREMYIYHFFTTSCFMFLTIVYAFKILIDKSEKFNYLVITILSIFVMVFINFYPIYSGMIVTQKHIESTKWLDSWVY